MVIGQGSEGLPAEELLSVSSDIMRAASAWLQSAFSLSMALHAVKTTLVTFLDNVGRSDAPTHTHADLDKDTQKNFA